MPSLIDELRKRGILCAVTTNMSVHALQKDAPCTIIKKPHRLSDLESWVRRLGGQD
jgi:hypothetical protein